MADKGLAAWDALREFCGGELPPDIDPVHYDYKQWEPFHEALAVGSWYATGVPTPGTKARPILAGLWTRGLYIDPNTDIASGIGYEFTDVRFFLTKSAARRWSPFKADKKAADEAGWMAMYGEHAAKYLEANGRVPTIDQDDAFYKAAHIPRPKGRLIRKAWREKNLDK